MILEPGFVDNKTDRKRFGADKELSLIHIWSLPIPAHDLAGSYLEEIDRRTKEKPVHWMLGSLDSYMGGIRTKELTTIGARPSVGKSAFLLQATREIARQGRKVLYLPLEMSTIQTVERLVQSKGGISQERLRHGRLTLSLIHI